jgi:adenylate cyclase
MRPGETRPPGRVLWRVGRLVLTTVCVTTNLVGVVAAVVFSIVVVPLPPGANMAHVQLTNIVAALAYIAVAVPLGVVIGTRPLLPLRDWLLAERPASAGEQRLVLRVPLRLFVVQASLWTGAATLIGALNAGRSVAFGTEIAIMVIITGLITASYAYLLMERLLRPTAARALAHGTPGKLAVPGVATRAVLAWGLSTGLPVAAMVTIGILELTGNLRTTPDRLAVALVAMGGGGVVVGLLVVSLAARATSDPVNSVRHGLARVAQGQLDVQLPVYDGTQIGQLQLGFNQMMLGLVERERIREALGTYVDPAVAERILTEGTSLAGEEVEVTIMFVDVRDFTGFAERVAAAEVVASINQLFERIVPVIHEHGGHVDKFVGDGLLAVFGAPRRQADHASQALAAALGIDKTVRSGAAGALRVGIGLNSGLVVAGNVGGAGRFEFTVIGDAVNVAARVEAATRQTGDTILLAQRTSELLRPGEVPLVPRGDVMLKGKSGTVLLYAPLSTIPAALPAAAAQPQAHPDHDGGDGRGGQHPLEDGPGRHVEQVERAVVLVSVFARQPGRGPRRLGGRARGHRAGQAGRLRGTRVPRRAAAALSVAVGRGGGRRGGFAQREADVAQPVLDLADRLLAEVVDGEQFVSAAGDEAAHRGDALAFQRVGRAGGQVQLLDGDGQPAVGPRTGGRLRLAGGQLLGEVGGELVDQPPGHL